MNKTQSVSRYVTFVFLITLFLFLFTFGNLQAADITITYQQIYSGEIITIEGNGFYPGETVSISEKHNFSDSNYDYIASNQTTQAGQTGSFSFDFIISDFEFLPEKLTLTATGESSSFVASQSAFFTNTLLSITSDFSGGICLDTIYSTSTIEVCAQLSQICDNGVFVDIANRPVSIFVNAGDCGLGNNLFATDFTNSDGEVCFSVPSSVILDGAQEISFRLKFDGESKPSQNMPPNSSCDESRINLSSSNDCVSITFTTNCNTSGIDFNITTSGTADIYYAVTADIDRDNNTDVIFSGNLIEGLYIAYGTSGSTLETPVKYANLKQASLSIDFLNADTLLDIVAITATTIYTLINNGDRTFTVDSSSTAMGLGNPFSSKSSNNQRAFVPSIVTDYFNDDVHIDVASAPDQLLLGDEFGNFTPTTLPFVFETVNSCDFNNDEFADLMISFGDSARIYLNDGFANFTQSEAVFIGSPSIDISPVHAMTDFNVDGECDFAIVLPLADSTEKSLITVALGDGTGMVSTVNHIFMNGLAYDMVVADINHDLFIDIVIANGTNVTLDIYLGDGTGGFDAPVIITLSTTDELTYALSTLDLDRDGNFDFVSGSLEGGNILLAIDQQADDPNLVGSNSTVLGITYEEPPEMSVIGYSETSITVITPTNAIISENLTTVAGSDFQESDFDNSGTLDDRTLDFNLTYGEYIIILEPESTSTGDHPTFSAAIGINGSQQVVIAVGLDFGVTRSNASLAPDSMVFYYEVEEVSSVKPANGETIYISRPIFDWSLKVADLPPGLLYHFQLDNFYDFRAPWIDEISVTEPTFQSPDISLGNDTCFYWHFRSSSDGGTTWGEFSRTFAVFVTDLCCIGNTGNVDGDSSGEVDIGDVSYLVNYIFNQGPEVACPVAGNPNGDNSGFNDISDLVFIVDYLFHAGPAPTACP